MFRDTKGFLPKIYLASLVMFNGRGKVRYFDPLFYMQKSVNSRDADVQKLQEMSENVEKCQKLSGTRISGYSKSMTF